MNIQWPWQRKAKETNNQEFAQTSPSTAEFGRRGWDDFIAALPDQMDKAFILQSEPFQKLYEQPPRGREYLAVAPGLIRELATKMLSSIQILMEFTETAFREENVSILEKERSARMQRALTDLSKVVTGISKDLTTKVETVIPPYAQLIEDFTGLTRRIKNEPQILKNGSHQVGQQMIEIFSQSTQQTPQNIQLDASIQADILTLAKSSEEYSMALTSVLDIDTSTSESTKGKEPTDEYKMSVVYALENVSMTAFALIGSLMETRQSIGFLNQTATNVENEMNAILLKNLDLPPEVASLLRPKQAA